MTVSSVESESYTCLESGVELLEAHLQTADRVTGMRLRPSRLTGRIDMNWALWGSKPSTSLSLELTQGGSFIPMNLMSSLRLGEENYLFC